MKKVLLATSFLVAGAGFAAAEVAVTGDGRMGLVYNGDDVYFSSRARVKFTMSGSTDSGLEFGASFRVDQEDEDGPSASKGGAGSIFVSGAFGKLEMGDVVGAAEAVLFDLPEIGYTDIANNDLGFLTGDGAHTSNNDPVALYTYSTGAVTFALSFNDGYSPDVGDETQEYAVGLGYSAGNYSFGIGYEVVDPVAGAKTKALWVGGTGTFGATSVSAYYGDTDNDTSEYGLGVTSTFDATTVSAFYKVVDFGPTDVSYYGLGASYDLGGGASVVGGIADNDIAGSDAVADLGLKFKF